MEVFKIGQLEVKRGEKKSGLLPVTNTDYELNVTIIRGCKGDKVLLLTAGVHSCEYVGIQTLLELSHKLEPEDVQGTVIIIPVINTTGFEQRTPSIVPEDGENLNRMFPGNPDGTESERLAAFMVKELYSKIDYYMDLHSGAIYEDLIPYVYVVGACDPEVFAEAQRAAAVFDVPYMVKSSSKTGAYNYAGVMGIPALLVERGCQGRWSELEVRACTKDIMNAMRAWGLMEGRPVKPLTAPLLIEKTIYQNAKVSGFW